MGYLDPVPKTFRLDSKDLQVPRKNAFEVLYSEKPLQCKQCGFRYPKTEKDQQKMDSHLDSHFRQNRKLKERVKRGLSRSWFVTVDEWIHGEGGESMSQQGKHSPSPLLFDLEVRIILTDFFFFFFIFSAYFPSRWYEFCWKF